MKHFDFNRKRLLTGFILGLVLIAVKTGYDHAYPNRKLLVGKQVMSCLPWDFYYWDSDRPVGEIKRYDLLIFPARKMQPVIKDGEKIVKMAAGLPGDKVTIRDGIVSINGSVIGDMAYGAKSFSKPMNYWDKEYVLQPNEIFVFGTEYNSYDSRYWGAYPMDLVDGHVSVLF